MALCEQIRRLRRQRGLTQEEVARALGVTAPTVSKWERGGYHLDKDTTLIPR